MTALLKVAIATLVLLNAASVYARGNIENGKKVVIAKACAACHGDDFKSPTAAEYPILAGQHQDYLVIALRSYQRPDAPQLGRKNAIMQGFAQQLSAQEIEDVAAYLASLPGPLVIQR